MLRCLSGAPASFHERDHPRGEFRSDDKRASIRPLSPTWTAFKNSHDAAVPVRCARVVSNPMRTPKRRVATQRVSPPNDIIPAITIIHNIITYLNQVGVCSGMNPIRIVNHYRSNENTLRMQICCVSYGL